MSAQPPPLPESPRLKAGCRFTLHHFDKGPSWVVENPATGKFFRMGLREERLARQLDGDRTILQILEALKKNESDQALSMQEALMFLQTLKGAGLLEEKTESEQKKPKPIFNPMFMKIPLGNPDGIFGWLASGLRALPSLPLAILAGLLMLTGAYAILSNLDRFTATMGSVFTASNITGFLACFVALKVIHETAHGVVCKYFGGRVPDAGLYFMFFMPLTYIDATASWRFPSKWVRILVTSAGILAELIVAAIAGLVWANTPMGFVNTIASNVVISASVTTLLFNANPLMRFDGYFILADLSGRPNLYTLASRAAFSLLGRVFLGIPATGKFPLWITLYGLGCMAWRISLIIGICVGAIALLHGIGIALAILTLVTSYLPFFRSIPPRLKALHERGIKISRPRVALLAIALLAIFFIPIQSPPATPTVIEPVALVPVRIQCPGFVQEVTVHAGQTVKAGQLLLRLENPEEQARWAKLKTDARRAEAEANILRDASEPRQMALQLEKASSLQKQAREVEAYLKTLSVIASQDGIVYARQLDQLLGAFLRTGQEVATIGSADQREARIAISQELFDRIQPRIDEPLQILVPGRLQTFDAHVVSIESAATRNIRHESLTALAAGPLAVVSTKQSGGQEKGMELVDPHFYVAARITSPDQDAILPGETGLTRFLSAPKRTLLAAAIEEVRAFIKRSSDRVTGQHS